MDEYMDVREKMVDILGEFLLCPSKMKNVWMSQAIEKLADHLIDNGVTVQEWISVNDRLPEEEGLYLVEVVNDHEIRNSKTAWYHGNGNWFLHQNVTHWMHLPQPPKGE